jgi:hypothetical protein
MVRCTDVLLTRGVGGTWLLDLQFEAERSRTHLQVPIGRHKALDRLAIAMARRDDRTL